MSQIKRLGMGLGALIDSERNSAETPTDKPTLTLVPASAAPAGTVEIHLLRPNPCQPRTDFDEKEIASLAESLKRDGFLQPVVVRPSGGGFYQIVAGERRWRAAKLSGLSRIPVVIREVDDRKMLELALIENLQRRDLNPMEKARAFRQLMQLHNWTQDQLADSVGMARPTVANFLRLLELPTEIQEAVSRGTISMGHARALLAVTQRGRMMQLLRKVIEEELSVRDLEKMITRRPAQPPAKAPPQQEPYLAELEQKLMDRLGVRVEIMAEAIVIPYGSNDQLTLVLRRLGVL
jgi:ParB family chromosome partitioning protein